MKKYVDSIKITVRSGNGGNGCMSFRRERFIPKGGPDGGNGGHGGSVFLKGDTDVESLYDFLYHPIWKAGNGMPGEGNNKTGAAGKDVYIAVPLGTTVYDSDGMLLSDICKDGQIYCAAEGGKGGRGNTTFKSSTNRAPRRADPGEDGVELVLKLEIRSIAHIGLAGLPNAGKSTLIQVLTAARPKVASYPFTTLAPVLGVLHGDKFPITIADIPGIIKGAHQNKGLGITFLRHIERTSLLIFVIDLCSEITPVTAYTTLCEEIGQYDTSILERTQCVVLTKTDICPDVRNSVENFANQVSLSHDKIIAVSSVTGENIEELKTLLFRLYDSSVEQS